jgi:AcrR family transcriptional regulator
MNMMFGIQYAEGGKGRPVMNRNGGSVQKRRPDRRIQRTRRLLLDSLVELILEKSYDAITVQDIIDRADVGRSTFYSHFQDKEHLLLSGSDLLHGAFEGFRSNAGTSHWDFSLALFRHAEEQRQVLKGLLGKQPGNAVLTRMQETLTAYLTEHFQPVMPKKASVPLDVLVCYFVSTFMGLLTWWLGNDIPYSAEEMNGYFQSLTEPATRALRPPSRRPGH